MLRVASTSLTITVPAVTVITGVNPIELIVKEQTAMHVRKAGIGKEMAKYQGRLRTLAKRQ